MQDVRKARLDGGLANSSLAWCVGAIVCETSTVPGVSLCGLDGRRVRGGEKSRPQSHWNFTKEARAWPGARSLQKRYQRRRVRSKQAHRNPTTSHSLGAALRLPLLPHIVCIPPRLRPSSESAPHHTRQPKLGTTSAMANTRRTSNFPTRTPGGHDRPGSRDADREEIWKPMLDNISSGKRLPEKSLLVLGKAATGVTRVTRVKLTAEGRRNTRNTARVS